MTTDTFTPLACAHCTEPTEPGDHFPTEDGAAYHVMCYRAACLDAGQPDPFPACDDCEQLIWEQAGDGALVIKGQKCELGVWRPARWHASCAPGAESPEIVEQLTTMMTKAGAAAREVVERTVVEAGNGADPDPPQRARDVGKPTCPGCKGKIMRGGVLLDGALYHKAHTPASVAAYARKRRPLEVCNICDKKIRRDNAAVEWEEPTEAGARVVFAHRACYRAACIAGGQDDPYPELAAESTERRIASNRANRERPGTLPVTTCGICQTNVLRAEFRDHVVAHEVEMRAKERS